jgi:hypothetical protein
MKYYCTDCHMFVKENHRCQQWETVYIIPEEALKSEQPEPKCNQQEELKPDLIVGDYDLRWLDVDYIEIVYKRDTPFDRRVKMCGGDFEMLFGSLMSVEPSNTRHDAGKK